MDLEGLVTVNSITGLFLSFFILITFLLFLLCLLLISSQSGRKRDLSYLHSALKQVLSTSTVEHCSACHTPLIENAHFCYMCGEIQNQQHLQKACKACMMLMPYSANYCPRCRKNQIIGFLPPAERSYRQRTVNVNQGCV